MADRLEWFDVTIPANTPTASPVTIPMVFPQGIVVEIDIKVLDGPCGSVGFHINAGGTQYVPRTAGSYIRPNDDYFTWPLEHAINSGSWGLTGYNIDSWDHNLQIGFQIREIGLAATPQSAGVGQSAGIITESGGSPSSAPPVVFDPLSVNSILASVDPKIMSFLVEQKSPPPDIGELTSAGTS